MFFVHSKCQHPRLDSYGHGHYHSQDCPGNSGWKKICLVGFQKTSQSKAFDRPKTIGKMQDLCGIREEYSAFALAFEFDLSNDCGIAGDRGVESIGFLRKNKSTAGQGSFVEGRRKGRQERCPSKIPIRSRRMFCHQRDTPETNQTHGERKVRSFIVLSIAYDCVYFTVLHCTCTLLYLYCTALHCSKWLWSVSVNLPLIHVRAILWLHMTLADSGE